MKYRVKPGDTVRLKDVDPDDHGGLVKGAPETEAMLTRDLSRLSALQERLYAEGRQSLLVVLQGMDTGGKDGTIGHVMRGLNPTGCQVVSFKAPTSEELGHDFLWRVHKMTPRDGFITVFNRSHYEDVLVARVHKLVPETRWKHRYKHINHFEENLHDHGTRVVKIFLYISKDEQLRRLQARQQDPTKQWKLAPEDVSERKLWDEYVAAYEDALSKCSTEHAPWYVVPANHKWYRNIVVAGILADTLEAMDPQWPKPKVDVSKLEIS